MNLLIFITLIFSFFHTLAFAKEFSVTPALTPALEFVYISDEDILIEDNKIKLNSKDWTVEKKSYYSSTMHRKTAERIRLTDKKQLIARSQYSDRFLLVNQNEDNKIKNIVACAASGQSCFSIDKGRCDHYNAIFGKNVEKIKKQLSLCTAINNNLVDLTNTVRDEDKKDLKAFGMKFERIENTRFMLYAGMSDITRTLNAISSICESKINWDTTGHSAEVHNKKVNDNREEK